MIPSKGYETQAEYNVRRFTNFLDTHTNGKPDLGAKSWAKREQTASRFAEIDFGCRFENGKCAGQRTGSHANRERACCGHCAGSYGYLTSSVNPADREFYIANFNGVTGFWREGKGCILPHAKRSATCLSYRCHEARNNAPRAFLLPWLAELGALPNYGGLHSAAVLDTRPRFSMI